jgi:Domain of unknown function (DUF3883)
MGALFGEVSYVNIRRAPRPSLHRRRAGVAHAHQEGGSGYGRRGEEAAYQAERNRLIAAGDDPERVRRVSRDIETADHDLESVGEDGKPIYIEVKTTSSDDPGEAFPISAAELLCAAKHQEHYFISRVTRVRDAVPRITAYAEPLNLVERGLATLDFAPGRMRLPPSALE